MPIVAKSVLAARRAAAAQAARDAEDLLAVKSSTPDIAASSPSLDDHADEAPRQSPERQRSKTRGHAVRNAAGKYQPTGDYAEGFARPPERTRFKPGCKAGPGRPKGSLSHDTLVRMHLDEKREVTIGGKRQRVSSRELVIMTTLKAAIEGKDKQARAYALAQTERLYPSSDPSSPAQGPSALRASDQLSLAEFEAELREQVRAELFAQYGLGSGEER